MTVQALLDLINSEYNNNASVATKVGYMNRALDELSAERFGPLVEDTSIITVEDQESYTMLTGMSDIADIDYLGVANTYPYQAETAVCTTGAETQAGTITVTVTAANMAGTPHSVALEVENADSAAAVAGKVRAALAADATLMAFFEVGGTGTSVILTALENVLPDSTMAIAVVDTDSTGVIFSSSTDSSVALLRSQYIKYNVGYADDEVMSGNCYFQTVDSSGVKKIALNPIPGAAGYRVMIRYNKKMTALAVDALTAAPEFDDRFHDILAYYAIKSLAGASQSPDTTPHNYWAQMYEAGKRGLWKLRMSRNAIAGSDRRDNPHWNRRRR